MMLDEKRGDGKERRVMEEDREEGKEEHGLSRRKNSSLRLIRKRGSPDFGSDIR